ncbi:MAG: DUF4249 domain-containing protein [Arcicella sp.]|jgi:hypothetical protein|nr:DUF4249 domain-containing protein [Arcicella sp.]
MKNLLFFFSVLLALSSCKSLVTDIDIPYEDRLVVQCFLSPQDTLLEVSVTKTAPVIGTVQDGAERYPNILNATVLLSDGQKTVTIPYQSLPLPSSYNADGEYIFTTRSRYFLLAKNLPIVAGKTYTLKVSAPGFTSVESACTIPIKVVSEKDISSEQTTVTGTAGRGGGATTYPSIQVRFKDIQGEENFYSIGQFFYQKGTYLDATGTKKLRVNWTTKYEYISDKGQENQTVVAQPFDLRSFNNFTSFGGGGSQGGGGGQQNIAVTVTDRYNEIYVANTDKAFYYYNTAIDKIRRANGNPFAEPVLTYTNIKNGLGVMAAYNQSRIIVKVN